jgi:transaldolase
VKCSEIQTTSLSKQETSRFKAGLPTCRQILISDSVQVARDRRSENALCRPSLEVSPLLANDAASTIEEAKRLHARAQCPNLFIKIPGTPAGLHAIEEAIFAGVPVNVTLLFSCEQYVAAADAYWRGIQRRVDAGLDPKVCSVASIFVSRWDKAVKDEIPFPLRNRLGIAIARRTYRIYRERMASAGWRKLVEFGALPQRLLWASTGTKDQQISDTYYVEALVGPHTINTMPGRHCLRSRHTAN